MYCYRITGLMGEVTITKRNLAIGLFIQQTSNVKCSLENLIGKRVLLRTAMIRTQDIVEYGNNYNTICRLKTFHFRLERKTDIVIKDWHVTMVNFDFSNYDFYMYELLLPQVFLIFFKCLPCDNFPSAPAMWIYNLQTYLHFVRA